MSKGSTVSAIEQSHTAGPELGRQLQPSSLQPSGSPELRLVAQPAAQPRPWAVERAGSSARLLDLAQRGLRVSVVIAALNEEQNLPYVFARLPDGLHEVIVVDGRSKDATIAVARALRPDVRILTQTGFGKGNALAEGFAACTGDIVISLDADGSTDPAEIPRFVAALCNGADFVKGSRFAQGGATSDMTLIRMLGNRFLNAVVNALHGTHYTDLCYGYNGFWARCLPYMRVDCDGFEVETLINVRIAKAGLVVHEVPSYEHVRVSGRSHLHAFRDGARVLHTIVVESRRRSRVRRRCAESWAYAPGENRLRRPQLPSESRA
jgi:glycosyltransferase involved in cell wall biosynthesis